MNDRVLELTSYVVTALATAGLAFVGTTQIVLHVKEASKRTARLAATATYYAMLVRRSLWQALKDIELVKDVDNSEAWWVHFGRMSAALGAVASDVREMALASIEKYGGSPTRIEHILRTFYDGAHQVNELADRNWIRDLKERQDLLATAVGDFQECIAAMEKEFSLKAAA